MTKGLSAQAGDPFFVCIYFEINNIFFLIYGQIKQFPDMIFHSLRFVCNLNVF